MLCRVRRKTAAAPQGLQAVQSAPPPQVVQAQPVFVQPRPVVAAAEVPTGLPVVGTSYPQVPVATPTDDVANAPPLLTMVEILKRQLGLDPKLNMQEVVEQACVQLGVDATQGNLVEKARKCWVLLGSPKS